MKVLWIGDAVVQSGFSVVTHNICNELHTKCDLSVFGIRYDGRAKNTYPYHVYPAYSMGNYYSVDFAVEVIKKETPDVVVVFNDLNVVKEYVSKISDIPIVPLFPINLLPLQSKEVFALSDIKYMLTYTEFSKQKILDISPTFDVTAIYHGVHSSIFFPVAGVKEQLGIGGKFVVGQVNTNTYRKRLDLFMLGFAKFAKDKPDTMCLIHATNKDIAYDLSSMACDLGIENKLILSSDTVSFEKINVIYNAIDVNVNTSLGEGFGLSLLEGAACGIPVLCPAHGNLKDIWGGVGEFIDIERQEYVAGTRFIGDVISIDSFVEQLNKYYSDRNYLRTCGEKIFKYSKSQKFSWKFIAEKIYKVLLSASGSRISHIS